jgi:predicted ribonuclease YlaK
MEKQKNYIIDTNVLLEDPNSLIKLRNGNENQVFIPYHVLLELNKIKKNPKLRHIVARVIEYLVENPDVSRHDLELIPKTAGFQIHSFSFANRCQTDFPHR